IVKPDGSPLPRTTQTAAEVVIDLDQEGARYTALMDPVLDGRLLIRFPDSSPPGVGANVKVWASGGLAWAGRIVTPTQPLVEMRSEPFEEGLATQITLERTGGAHPFPDPLRIEGVWFGTTQGQPWSMIGCSDFALLANKLTGYDAWGAPWDLHAVLE